MPNLLTGTGRALLGSNPDLAWMSLLQANATYAWTGASGLTLATWTDVVGGVVATAAGSGTTIGTLNGKPTAVFNGSGYYLPAAAASLAAQPYAVLAVARLTGSVASIRMIYDGRTGGSILQLQYANTTGAGLVGSAGGTITSAAAMATTAVTLVTANGASSSLRANGIGIASGTLGSDAFGTPAIAARVNGTVPFIGSIADVIIVAGADYVARAAIIEAAALVRYGLG